MPPDLLLTARSTACPGPIAVPGGASVVVGVPDVLLSWHAVYTGAPLPAASSPFSRFMYRASTEATLWACLEGTAGQWRATQLYHEIETSEKAQASYRLGTICAGLASDLALGLPLLVHRETLFGKSAGKRGDLLGLRVATGDWHGVEAKGKSPEWPSGEPQKVGPADFDGAKAQAQTLGVDLVGAALPTGTGDHWAVTSRASTSEPLEMTLDDPPEGSGHTTDSECEAPERGGDAPPPEHKPDFAQEDPFERLLQGYYQVVGDLEALVALGAGDRASSAWFGDEYLGAPLPGANLWLGARRELFTARREERLRDVVPEIAQADPLLDDTRYAAIGLALERLAPASRE